MSLHKFCQRLVVTVTQERSIMDACRLLEENNVGCMVVEDNGRICGILTDRDVALKVTGESKDPQKTKVEEIMTRNPVRISIDKGLQELTSLMHSSHVRRVPIVNGLDKVLGIVTLDDLIAVISDEMFEIGRTVAEGFPAGTA